MASLKKLLGTQGLVTIDPLTGSPRQIARADGFLTGPSKARARDIALGYVRANHGVFGLDASALAGLTLRKDYVDVDGHAPPLASSSRSRASRSSATGCWPT